MMQPDNSYWKKLADSAATRWHLEEEEEKRFKKELEAQNAKYVRAIDAKISDEITGTDFELWKASVAKEVERLEDSIKGIEAKRQVTKQLMDAPEIKESFADRWLKTSDLDDKQAFQRSLFPDGIFWSHTSVL
jgi:polyhydroxyalkanoate synthesis regulator phasin